MACTQAQRDWLADDVGRTRCLLVEAEYGGGGTEYMSTSAFVSKPTDTVPNIPYEEIIVDVLEIESSISGDVSLGKIVVTNPAGELDSWLSRAWRGWPLRVYLGCPGWSKDDFILIGAAICGGISASRQDRLALEMRDKRELLSEEVQTSLMSSGVPKPLSLGTVFNAEPVLQDSATLRYRYHENGNAVITAVRDNGVTPASVTDQGDGSFILGTAPSGRITCDVNGETTGTPAAMVEWLALRSPEISSADIDSTNLAAFSATYGLGMYIRDSRDIQSCIADVMSSVGGVARFSRLGLLQIMRLDVPGTASLSLVADDVVERGLTLVGQEEPNKRVTLGYKKNWAVQDEGTLAGSVSAANRDLYGKEHSTVTADNSGITTNYPLAPTPDVVETLIVSSADAQTEADRRRTLRGVKRTQYQVRGFSAPFQAQVGETVEIVHPRYGFSSGDDAVIVGMKQSPTKNKVTLEVWL